MVLIFVFFVFERWRSFERGESYLSLSPSLFFLSLFPLEIFFSPSERPPTISSPTKMATLRAGEETSIGGSMGAGASALRATA